MQEKFVHRTKINAGVDFGLPGAGERYRKIGVNPFNFFFFTNFGLDRAEA
jgi:hypothetical protein